ncbi:hypothetical protein SARC_10680 [Sphaeroforma arctica JP610]|uniref:C-CAP/cofactor C-like domain-containing protein n=1 Tax=Sphaeroforma arctica JP610 TaxID=667725 RepID=A0A0L0FJ80_9EUKA|nr:hypothetical protein SARC_10680 [Sphaeroforma arctica JP610]KNC76844.1 hypothetical protein SARC_10680 [Sphaeroforma arctica JP610]|eukprot:XP_014150746.1 hypothetical protein SARC_10680 [Sphaeroforma arctica JP610]
MASQSQKPSDSDFPALLGPTAQAMTDVSNLKDDPKYRRSKFSNHLATVAEGIAALGWVSVPSKPAPFCKDMSEAGEFYGNRVIKEFKDEDKTHVEWARAFKAIWPPMVDYIKKYHTTALSWNKNGGKATVPSGGPAPAAPAAKAPPPPPPKPSVSSTAADTPKKSPLGGLFAEINKGGAVTSGLKKVDKSQMTHKNPELRASSKVEAAPEKETKKPAAPSKFGAGAKKGTPKCELDGKKWLVEHQDGNNEIVIDTNMSQVVYIYKCTNSVIKINGKVNSIALDGCKKVGVVFDKCVSGVEMVTCQSVQVQATGSVPTVSIDKTDGVQVYLSEKSLDCQIISAKSSEMNVSIPGATPEDDLVESPIVEQFRTTLDPKTRKWTTTIMDSI